MDGLTLTATQIYFKFDTAEEGTHRVGLNMWMQILIPLLTSAYVLSMALHTVYNTVFLR